jgi:hypothetical protein
MATRPTTTIRQDCKTTIASSANNNHLIIGDTVSGTLYTNRLVRNGVTSIVHLLNEGVERLTTCDIEDVSFIVNHNKVILHHLNDEQVHLMTCGESEHDNDDQQNITFDDLIYQYYYGAGALGDFIASYLTVRVGPWFDHSTHCRAEKFVNCNTTKFTLNSAEKFVHDKIVSKWGIVSTSKVIVNEPSILNVHYKFVQYNDETSRELFLDEYHFVNNQDNVDIYHEVENLTFNKNGSLYDVSFDAKNNSQTGTYNPIWMTNPYTYLRLANEGGYNNKNNIRLPTHYRAVIAISESNTGGVDLTSVVADDELVTSYLAFSLYDINNPNLSNLTWLIEVYTTKEDLSVVHPAGAFSETGKTLLIVNAICTKNTRKASYSTCENEVQVRYNSYIAEDGYRKQFAKIVAGLYQIYTNTPIDPNDLINEASTCGATTHICHEANRITDYVLRESPIEIAVRTLVSLYGGELYPRINKC